MLTYKKNLIVVIFLPILLLLSNYVAAQENDISKIENLPIEEAFEKLKEEKYIYNPKLMDDAIDEAFKNREKEAVDYSILELGYPMNEFTDEDVAIPNYNFDVAKAILHKYPGQSQGSLLKAFNTSETIKKGNIVRVMGILIDKGAIRGKLIQALDDKSFVEDEFVEDDNAIPLRICDLAYNQIVLHGRVKKVLRTIGIDRSLENRDYHIDLLKKRL